MAIFQQRHDTEIKRASSEKVLLDGEIFINKYKDEDGNEQRIFYVGDGVTKLKDLTPQTITPEILANTVKTMTVENNGIGRPDGDTITVNEDGIFSAKKVVITSDIDDDKVLKTYHIFHGSHDVDGVDTPIEIGTVKIPLDIHVSGVEVITATGNETIDDITSANLESEKKYIQFNIENSDTKRIFLKVEDFYSEFSAEDEATEIQIHINKLNNIISAELLNVSTSKIHNDLDSDFIIHGGKMKVSDDNPEDEGDFNYEESDHETDEEFDGNVVHARIIFRNEDLESLMEENPILYKGEIAFINDKKRVVIGDGISQFNELSQYDYTGGTEGQFKAGSGIYINEQNEIENTSIIFVGTHEEWNDLSDEEKNIYAVINFIDGNKGVYRYEDSNLIQIAGQMSVEYGMTTIREGTVTEQVNSKETMEIEIEFDTPMPDNKYLTSIEINKLFISYTIMEKTENGMCIIVTNNNSSTLNITVDWKAYKLFEVATIPEMLNRITGLQTKELSSAISIDNVEKTTVESAIEEISESLNKRLKIVKSIPTNPKNDDVVLYMGNNTYTYDRIENVINPKSEGLYEYDNFSETYILSNDESIIDDKSYFKKNKEYIKGTFYMYFNSWLRL